MRSDKQCTAVSRVQEHCQLSGKFLGKYFIHTHTHTLGNILHVLHPPCALSIFREGFREGIV